MRSLARRFLTGAIALYITTRIIPGFIIEGSLIDFVVIALIFTLVQLLVRPLIHMLLLPFHFLTLGTVSWVVNLITLYGLTFFVEKVKILPFHFNGLTASFFAIPPLEVTAFLTALLTSISLGVFGAFFHWFLE